MNMLDKDYKENQKNNQSHDLIKKCKKTVHTSLFKSYKNLIGGDSIRILFIKSNKDPVLLLIKTPFRRVLVNTRKIFG